VSNVDDIRDVRRKGFRNTAVENDNLYRSQILVLIETVYCSFGNKNNLLSPPSEPSKLAEILFLSDCACVSIRHWELNADSSKTVKATHFIFDKHV